MHETKPDADMMIAKRIWSIEEQVIVDTATKLRFEFTSSLTEALASREESTSHDDYIMLNVYNESGTKVIRLAFQRNDKLIDSTVEAFEPENVPPASKDEAAILHALPSDLQAPGAPELYSPANLIGQDKDSETLWPEGQRSPFSG